MMPEIYKSDGTVYDPAKDAKLRELRWPRWDNAIIVCICFAVGGAVWNINYRNDLPWILATFYLMLLCLFYLCGWRYKR